MTEQYPGAFPGESDWSDDSVSDVPTPTYNNGPDSTSDGGTRWQYPDDVSNDTGGADETGTYGPYF